MSGITVAIIGVVLLLLLLAIRVPVAFALGLSGAAGLVLVSTTETATRTLGTSPFASVSTLTLAVIPMFIMMGMLAEEAGVPGGLFRLASRWLRRVPGGLAVATIAAGAGFGAVTGSSVASAATIGKLSIGEMRRYGYRTHFASGAVAIAGTLGVLIPPSVILVLYGVVTGESVGRLLLGGIVPGIISALFFGAVVIFQAKTMPHRVFVEDMAPTAAPTGGDGAVRTKGDLRHLVWILLVFLLVVGGIYSGLFTATESGAIGALVLAVLLFIERVRSGARSLGRSFARAAGQTASTTAMMLAIVIGASIFSTMLTRTGLTQRITSFLKDLDVAPLVLAAIFVVLLIFLGTILETLSLMLIAIPLMYPVMAGMGVDGIWFGVIAAKAIEIGLITPPVGMNAYVVAASTKGVKVEQVFRGIVPFYIAEVAVFVTLFLAPGLVTWLPGNVR